VVLLRVIERLGSHGQLALPSLLALSLPYRFVVSALTTPSINNDLKIINFWSILGWLVGWLK
jgi:hypothetical protein